MTRTDVPPILVEVPPRVIRLGRTTVFGLLFALFDLGFILSPYWQAAPHLLQFVALAIFIPLGLGWAALAAREVEIPISKRSLWLLVCSILMVGYFSRRALMQSIAFRGDEDWHLLRSMQLFDFLVHKHAWAGFGLFVLEAAFIGMIIFRPNLSRRRIIETCIVFALMQAGILATINYSHAIIKPWDRLGRYPFFETWWSLGPAWLASWAIRVTPPLTSHYSEAVWRMVPFLSAVLLAWLVGKHISARRPFVRLLTILTAATVPLMMYYDSILYLEMPAVLLMTVVCFDAANLLDASSEELRRRPTWLALLAIGFCKETVLPFLLAFALCRIILKLRKWDGIRAKAEELAVLFLPLALFLTILHVWVKARTFSPDLHQLLGLNNYQILARSYAQQFGPLAILSALGIGVMLAQGKYLELLFFGMAFFGDTLLHLLDNNDFLGYSRFNLFLLPVILVTAWNAIEAMASLFSPIAWTALGLVILGNVEFFCPIHLDDGSRLALWGNNYGHYDSSGGYHGFDTTDHTYPYREVIRYLSSEHPNDTVMFTGKWYRYDIEFYLKHGVTFEDIDYKKWIRRLHLREEFTGEWYVPDVDLFVPKDAQYESINNKKWYDHDLAQDVQRALLEGDAGGYDFVVYHLYGLTEPRIHTDAMRGYMKCPVPFANDSHELMVFEKRKKHISTRPSQLPPSEDDAP